MSENVFVARRHGMKMTIDFTRRTQYADVREPDSISILCLDSTDGLAYFNNHYPESQGYEIESYEIVTN
jgi:hypothetical protein